MISDLFHPTEVRFRNDKLRHEITRLPIAPRLAWTWCLLLMLIACSQVSAQLGPFPTAAGQPGSTAIPRTSALFVNWANSHVNYRPGAAVDPTWQDARKAYGPAGTNVMDILCLGNGGSVTMCFPNPIRDGAGPDFAVFENAFANYFVELAFVEVSSDGTHFHRFPTASLWEDPIGGFGDGYYDPSYIDGFAGKYAIGFGTPFDLALLPDSPTLDKQNIRFVRLTDIIGDGSVKDSAGRPIYDPTPTVGSGGFDLDAIGVIHENRTGPKLLAHGPTPSGFRLRWESTPGTTYRIEQSDDLQHWQPAAIPTVPASPIGTQTEVVQPTDSAPRRFWRIAVP